MRYEWLSALEDTGCIDPSRGWLAMHIAAYSAGELVGVAPAYIKGNSEGEFVFDHSFARYAQGNLRIDYYPKLIVAVPFTPATGPRFLLKPGVDAQRLLAGFASALPQLSERLGVSGAHVLFPDRAQADALEAKATRRVTACSTIGRTSSTPRSTISWLASAPSGVIRSAVKCVKCAIAKSS